MLVPLVLGPCIMEGDLCLVWFSEKQQFVFMDKPEYFPLCCLTVSGPRQTGMEDREK